MISISMFIFERIKISYKIFNICVDKSDITCYKKNIYIDIENIELQPEMAK